MFEEIDSKLRETKGTLKRLGCAELNVSTQEFSDYMTADTFSGDTITLRDVLGNKFLMIHELVEISELKKAGKIISKKIIVNSPKNVIYDAHFAALEAELNYALQSGDTYWVKLRLKQHKTGVLDDDPNLPKELRPRAEMLLRKFDKLIETYG